MQKLKQELNANPVGANCIRPHFEGTTIKNQKGITLIALIITIIVMLILVGVTINVALNGGLFKKAETATRETEEKAILEEMLAMMIIDDNGKFKPDEIIANMKAKHPEYEIDDSNKPNVTIKGKLGTYKYVVSETEIKIGSKENKTFNWKELGLTVDTDTDYKFYDTRFSTTYVINFTTDGKLIVKADGTVVETYDATEEDDGILTIPFTYAGTTYDTTLTMNSNNVDVDAELKGLTTVTYIKVEEKIYPVAYGDYDDGVIALQTTENEIILSAFESVSKFQICECTNLNSIEGFEDFEVANYGNIIYSKVALASDGAPTLVYSENSEFWYTVGIYQGGTITIAGNYPLELNREITQEQIDSIIQAANATSE